MSPQRRVRFRTGATREPVFEAQPAAVPAAPSSAGNSVTRCRAIRANGSRCNDPTRAGERYCGLHLTASNSSTKATSSDTARDPAQQRLPRSYQIRLEARSLALDHLGDDSLLAWARTQAESIPGWLPTRDQARAMLEATRDDSHGDTNA